MESLLEARALGGLFVTWETQRWHERHPKPLIWEQESSLIWIELWSR